MSLEKPHDPSALALAVVIVLSGTRALQDTNCIYGVATTVYRRELGSRCFGQKFDSEDNGKHLREARSGAPLVYEKCLRLSTKLFVFVLGPRVGFYLRRGTNED